MARALNLFSASLTTMSVVFGASFLLAAPPAPQAKKPPPPLRDMGHAVPASNLSHLPTTEQQYQSLQQQIAKGKPAAVNAKRRSEQLRAQAMALKRKLIATAARVQQLEADKITLAAQIVSLSAQEKVLAASFAQDRVGVSHLLALVERLQTDMPPAMVMKPDDALGASRGAMILGATLPRLYGAAATLARRIDALRDTRQQLALRRAEGVRNAAQLTVARGELNQLLAIKQLEAEQAQFHYGELQAKLDTIADQASDLESLLAKVAALRAGPGNQSVIVVAAVPPDSQRGPAKGSLLTPVVGKLGGPEFSPGPGLNYVTSSAAQVIAPSDSRVLFAGPYHKTGQVLILESGAGYDLVLEGLDRVTVRPGDQLLAGEPLGTMPRNAAASRLYFELRLSGRALDPTPWLAESVRKAKRT